ncbi:MAG: ABC transporter permease [Bacteroidales bacterium]|nr:ABC transporter permease [Bacteroidales bacterium]
MIKNYLLTAFRSILRYKGYSFINIAGLAIGMACSILIMVWVAHELSYDRFNEKSDRLYRLVQTQYYSSGPLTTTCMPGPIARDLVDQYPEIEDGFMFYFVPGAVVNYGEKNFNENIRMADPGLFRIFDFEFISGDPETALDEVTSIVITREMAEKYFPGEDPMGKLLRLNDDYNFKVTAVVNNIRKNSSFRFDFCVPFLFLEEIGQDLKRYGWNSYYSYILLADGITEEAVESKIIKHIETQGDEDSDSNIDLWLHPLSKIHLHDVRGGGLIDQVYILSAIAVFILLIACINFMNLATARSSKRAREIGLRKVVGANRGKIIFQFLIDSMLLSFIAVIFSAIIVVLVMPAFNRLADSELTFNLLNPANLLILIGVGLFTGLLAGSYPAVFLSSFNPIRVLKISNSGTKGSSLFRKGLVVFQFTLSVILIIATIVIVRQQYYMQEKDLGISMENVIYVDIEGNVKDNYQVMKIELLQESSILGVTRANTLPFWMGSNGDGFDWQDRDVDNDVLVGFGFAGYDYDDVLGMEFTEGRYYDREFATDTSDGIVINESMLRMMNMKDPIGKWLANGDMRWKIIGVMSDFHFLPLTYEISPFIMGFASTDQTGTMMIKIGGDNPRETIAYVEDVWTRINPAFPFNYDFLDKEYQQLYESENRLGTIFTYFAFLAIFISCLGLLGLASFMAEQRTKEIGIRKTFGAPVGAIVMMMSKEFAKLVLIANIIAIPVAWYLLKEWLTNYSYTTRLSADIFIIAFLLSILIAWLTISFQAIKAALMNPVEAIKYE